MRLHSWRLPRVLLRLLVRCPVAFNHCEQLPVDVLKRALRVRTYGGYYYTQTRDDDKLALVPPDRKPQSVGEWKAKYAPRKRVA